MSDPVLMDALVTRLPDAIQEVEAGSDGVALTVSPRRLLQVCELLRDDPGARFNQLATLTRANRDVLYQLTSLSRTSRLRLRVPLSEDASDEMESVSFVWPAANWAEREAQDLWGLRFAGHPNPAPLLRPVRSAHAPDNGPRVRVRGGTRYPASLDGLDIALELDRGQRVKRIRLHLGKRHSALESRLAEWPAARGVLLAARVDGFGAMSADLAFALAAEQLLGVVPPPRAQMLRVALAELQRIASHLFWVAHCAQNLADPPFAAPAYAWQGRTAILDLFQWLGGNPITPDVIAIGGLGCDVPFEFVQKTRALLGTLEPLLDDLDRLLTHSPGFREQLEGVGVIDPGTALGLGVTGPCLRACGIQYDVRQAFPYAAYDLLDLDVVVAKGNDADARYRARMAEMRSSLHLVDQAVSRLENGPVNVYQPDQLPALPAGTAYASVEGPRGELGVLMTANGDAQPRRVHLRGPSFANLSALPFMVRGAPRSQVGTALDSLDISMGEVER